MTDATNPYQDEGLRKAWAAGYAAGGKRHTSRVSNPYFNDNLKQAWYDGFDTRKVAKANKGHRWL